MTLTDEKLRELIALADKATPGERTAVYQGYQTDPEHQCVGWQVDAPPYCVADCSESDKSAHDARFIAACDPTTVAEMAREVMRWRELDDSHRETYEAGYHDGKHFDERCECYKCKEPGNVE